MITPEKLKLYRKYKDDLDGFTRWGKQAEKDLLNVDEVHMIENVIQDLLLIEKQLCSLGYKKRVLQILNENFDEKARELIQSPANFI